MNWGRILLLVMLVVACPASSVARSQGRVGPRPIPMTSCGFVGLPIGGMTISLADAVPAGRLSPSPATNAAAVTVPAICRVVAALHPTTDSDIAIEVWLPQNGWNRKFQAVGNGAFTGNINYGAMATAVTRGYAVASTDTGHTGGGAAWALGHPEKLADWAWRAVHEMTVAAKRLVNTYYAATPVHSYWNGCSAGGRQAMKEAQRFPDDFDGIVAGSPGLDWTGRAVQATRVASVLEPDEAGRLPQAKRQLLHRAVVNACDAIDGLTDGLIADPSRCTFDPGALTCDGADGPACLTRPQVATARLIYSPLTSATGHETAGLARGSELGWTDLGWTTSARDTGLHQFRFLVFRDPAWTIGKFNPSADLARADDMDAGAVNAMALTLEPFFRRGGKLLQYHGWSDPQISPGNSTQYYTRASQALGGPAAVQNSYRLFMVPGMGHCSGGEGPNAFDALGALEQWVEQGVAPDRLIASGATGGVVRTRPLCPFPQIAVYKGSGSIDQAENFECRTQ